MELIETVRIETKEEHLHLDKLVFPLIQQTKTKDDYAKLLNCFYGYFKPVNDQVNEFITSQHLPDIKCRRSPDWIIDDLHAIGKPGSSLQICTDIPTIQSFSAALGAYYVLEGSTMGGSIIANKLKQNLKSDVGLKFFTAYGNDNKEYWKIFIDFISHASDIESSEVSNSAIKTFQKFKNWIIAFYGK